jgi:hypothetical protein
VGEIVRDRNGILLGPLTLHIKTIAVGFSNLHATLLFRFHILHIVFEVLHILLCLNLLKFGKKKLFIDIDLPWDRNVTSFILGRKGSLRSKVIS